MDYSEALEIIKQRLQRQLDGILYLYSMMWQNQHDASLHHQYCLRKNELINEFGMQMFLLFCNKEMHELEMAQIQIDKNNNTQINESNNPNVTQIQIGGKNNRQVIK